MRSAALQYRCKPGLTRRARQWVTISAGLERRVPDLYDVTQPAAKTPAYTPTFNADWAGLDKAQQAAVREAYTGLPEQDEPPYPSEGMGPLLESLRQRAEYLELAGHVLLAAQVDAQGKVQSVNVLDSPDARLAKYAAARIAQAAFKPARCAGSPCAMVFAFEATVSRQAPPNAKP